MNDQPKPPPIPLRRRNTPAPATQAGGGGQAPPSPPPSPPRSGGVGREKFSAPIRPAEPPKPAAKPKAPPQPRKVRPGWRIVYRKDPADLGKMGMGGEPPVWIAEEEWGCPFRILEVAAHAPLEEGRPLITTWIVFWTGHDLGEGYPIPGLDVFHPATYFDRREAAKAAQRAFRAWLRHPDQVDVRQRVREGLRGRRLACMCGRKSPCHGDVLIKVANETEETI
jgi:hypothetical protein